MCKMKGVKLSKLDIEAYNSFFLTLYLGFILNILEEESVINFINKSVVSS